jgi:hypothetical protein
MPLQRGTFSYALTALVAFGALTPEDARAELELEWTMALYGSGIGLAGLVLHDLDGNGKAEIIAGGGSSGFRQNSRWYVVTEMPNGEYAQVYVSAPHERAVVTIVVADLDLDSASELYVALEDGTLLVYDPLTFLERTRFSVGHPINHLVIDGGEMFILGDNETSMYRYDGGQYVPSGSAPHGGSRIAVGNVDTDDSSELVIADRSSIGVVVDRNTAAVEWTQMTGFGVLVELADLDEDGMEEIVAAEGWSAIRVFDADLRAEKMTVETSHDIGSLSLSDVTGDGLPEIIYGDNQWGAVHVVSVETRQDLFSVANPEHGTTDVVVGDVGGDGTMEIIWGAGASSTGPDHLYVADTVARQIVWESLDLVGPLAAVDLADMDGDGTLEIVMCSSQSNSSYGDGVLHVIDGETHYLEYHSTDLPDVHTWGGVASVKVAELDGDADLEYLLSLGHLYNGVLQVYDARTHALEDQSMMYKNLTGTLEVGDLDGDGTPEIALASAGPFHLRVLRTTLNLEWETQESTQQPIYAVAIANVDTDPALEIILTTRDRIVVYDGVTRTKQRELATSAHGLAIAAGQIVVGTDDGAVTFHNGDTLERSGGFSVGTGRIAAVRVEELVAGAGPRVIAAGDEIFAVATLDGRIQWSREGLDFTLGENNHLEIGNVDADPELEVIVGGASSLFQFEASGVELCDDTDNDGDGEVDEMLFRACATVCGAGTERCVGGAWVACTAEVPSSEICDGNDNDCDGMSDEDQVCGACVDGDGYGTACTLGPDCDDQNPATNPGAEEAGAFKCQDLVDNDCDTLIDSEEISCRSCTADVDCETELLCHTAACGEDGMCRVDPIPGCSPPLKEVGSECSCTSVQDAKSGLFGMMLLSCLAGFARLYRSRS